LSLLNLEEWKRIDLLTKEIMMIKKYAFILSGLSLNLVILLSNFIFYGHAKAGGGDINQICVMCISTLGIAFVFYGVFNLLK
jgi:hypothetical protein